ncbi:hypothetical protein C900_00385 [Fulvivirga imtechensis AK7]|uniref:Uncharacterized protein n=1 Tax=Fulvivirga imtechensis AK7 TaxID=1237149 RepID=L8JM02_9BACT|nr:hypothetical protein C900_00385 [Fulvivirga imtechensis AK7]
MIITACSFPSGREKETLEREIAAIETDAQFTQYLIEIRTADQKYRQMEPQIQEKYGHDSQEYQDVWEMINLTDQQNLLKVELLLEKFGYPRKAAVGTSAAEVPWLIVHHAADYNLRVQYFSLFYSAWKDGNLSDDAFSLFLERMHIMKFDKYFSFPGPYKHEEKVEALIRKLGL